MRTRTLLVVALMAAGFARLAEATPRQMQMTFGGYTNRSETLTNFPVLVVLSNNVGQNFTFADFVTTNGYDLRFVTNSTSTNWLNYEIESWNTNAGQACYVWVRVPTIPSNGTGSIWAKWGDSANSNQLACTTNGSTWSDDYRGVWHLSEAGGSFKDATTNRADSSAAQVGAGKAGAIAGGQQFSGSTNYIQTPLTNKYPMFTLSALVKPEDMTGQRDLQEVISKRSYYATLQGDFPVALYLGASGTNATVYVDSGNDWSLDLSVTAGGVRTGAWNHVAGMYDGTTLTIFVNGQAATTNGTVTLASNTRNWTIGRATFEQAAPNGVGRTSFNGYMDEVRIANRAQGTNWLWACWLNQASNGTFSAYGAMEAVNADLPAVANGAAANVLVASANLSGTLTTNGLSAATVYLFCATNDCTTDEAAWIAAGAIVTNVGPFTSGAAFTNTLTGLAANTLYYWNHMASNASGKAWATTAGSPSFTTLRATSPQQMQIAFGGYTNRSETLTNFPVLVVLSNNVGNSGFTFDNFASVNGYDLRFATNSMCTSWLNYEIESWNTNAGQACYVWVQVPTIPGNGTGAIWAKWGDAAHSGQLPCTTNGTTWDSGFKGVWHGAVSSGDSTANSRNGTDTAISYGASYGKIGAGANTAANPSGIAVPTSTLGAIGTGDFTTELWLKPNAPAAGNYPMILASYNNSDPYIGPSIFYDPLNVIGHGDGITFRVVNTNEQYVTSPSASSMYGNWQHIVFKRESGVNTVYYNGAQKLQFTDNTSITAPGSAYLFSRSDFTLQAFSAGANGDEFRISNVSRSSNWVWACWLNQASNGTFAAYGAMVGPGAAPFVQTDPSVNVSSSSATLNGTLVTTGSSATAVFVYYGPTDGGTNAGAWAATNASLTAPQPLGARSVTVALSAGGEYFYRFAASNAAGVAWADSSQYLITTNVTVAATPDTVGEANAAGLFTVTRPAALTNGALTVTFTLAGTASNGVDYTALAGSLTIPAGATGVAVQALTALPDGVVDGGETVGLTVSNTTCTGGAPSPALLTIADTPTVGTLAASGVTATSATLNGSLSAATDTAVIVYYGPADGGTNAGAWAATNTDLAAPQAVGGKSVTVSSLAYGRQYYYRYAAQNAGGVTWATNSQSFVTLTATWSGSADNEWANGGNWSFAPVPGSGDAATFNNTGNGNTTVDLGAGVTVSNIQFDTADCVAYTLGAGAAGSQALTLNNGGAITVSSTVSNNQGVNAALTLGTDGSTRTFTLAGNSATGALTLAGTVTGSTGTGTKTLALAGAGTNTVAGAIGDGAGGGKVAVSQTGAGASILTGANTYSGGTTISAGTLQAGNGGASGSIGSGDVTLWPTGSKIVFHRNDNQTLGNTFLGSGSLAGDLMHSGAGTLTLTGNSAFSFVYTASGAGALTFATSSTLKLGSSAGGGYCATLYPAAGTTITVAGALQQNSGSSVILYKYGDGTAYIGDATVSGFNQLHCQAGALDIVGTSQPTLKTLVALFEGWAASNPGGVIQMSGSYTPTLGSQVHWYGPAPYSDGGFAARTGPLTVNINSGATLKFGVTSGFLLSGRALVFGSETADNGVTFQNPLDLNNAVQTNRVIDNPNSTGDVAVLAGALSNGGLTKTGNGTLILGGTNTYSGATTVSSGTLLVNGEVVGTVTVTGGSVFGGTGAVKSTVTVNAGAILTAADTNAVGTLAVTNLTLAENSVLVWNYSDTSQDLINVAGTLTLPTVATVVVSRAVSSARWPASAIVMTFGAGPVDGRLPNWVLRGDGLIPGVGAYVRNKQVQLVSPGGSVFKFR